MSKLFGDIRQLAFVVTDIDEAMRFWSDHLGIGPFFIKRSITFNDFLYRGNQCPSPITSIALANSGYIQIELIQQHDDTPSIFKEQLDSGQVGLQHVSAWLTTEGLIRKREELLTKGYEIAQECVIPSSGVKLVYFGTENGPGNLIFEISDLLEPTHYERALGIKSAYEQWDGQSNAVIEVDK